MAPNLLQTIDDAERALAWALASLEAHDLFLAAVPEVGFQPPADYLEGKGKAEVTINHLRELQSALGRKSA